MRAILIAIVAVFLAALGAVQFASESLSAAAAAPGTLPRRIPPAFGDAVYGALDRVAPAPYVETALAQRALARGDLDAAQHHALRLPASSNRDALLERVAQARGETPLALEYALAAYDYAAVETAAQALSARDPAAAYALERTMAARLSARKTDPGEAAQARWQMGLFANETAWRKVPGSAVQRQWLLVAQHDFDRALALAPLSERYAIAAANQADLLDDRVRAQALFRQAFEIDPGSADALAGLGVVAWQNGDVRTARAYLARARALDSNALMVHALERDVK